MNDTPERYGGITRFFHWTMAVLVLWQFLKLGDRIDDGEHWIGQTLVPWHISIGVLLLALAALRTYWLLKQRPQRPQHTGSRAPLIKGGHFSLYLLMILVPVTGVLLMAGNGYGLEAFGMELIAQSESKIDWMISLGNLHSPLALLFVAIVIGHIGAALYHHFIDRDGTMQRMLG